MATGDPLEGQQKEEGGENEWGGVLSNRFGSTRTMVSNGKVTRTSLGTEAGGVPCCPGSRQIRITGSGRCSGVGKEKRGLD